MYCEKCGTKLRDNARFCEKCGAVIEAEIKEIICPKCGAKNALGSIFCENCGIKLENQEVVHFEYPKKKNKSKLIILFMILILIFTGIVVAVFLVKQKINEKEQTIEEIYEQEHKETEFAESDEDYIIEQEELDSEETIYSESLEESKDETNDAAVENEGGQITESTDYILEASDSRYISWSELNGFSKEECRLARNEIYARHGRKFDDKQLQEYFNSKDWYYPSIEADDFSNSILNSYEKANCELIVEYEEEQGYR